MSEKQAALFEFINAGWALSHAIDDEDVCNDRTCFRCKLVDVILSASAKANVLPYGDVVTDDGLIPADEYYRREAGCGQHRRGVKL